MVDVTIRARMFDLLNRTEQQVVLIGEAMLTAPVQPPTSPGVPTHPIMLPGMPGWGDPRPTHPIMLPGMPGWGDPHPAHPIVIPPDQAPQPPETPPPGTTTPVPPPTGTGGWPVAPIVPPPYIVVNYPGWGPIYVTPPASAPAKAPPPATPTKAG